VNIAIDSGLISMEIIQRFPLKTVFDLIKMKIPCEYANDPVSGSFKSAAGACRCRNNLTAPFKDDAA
jgi:hypothetical protein